MIDSTRDKGQDALMFLAISLDQKPELIDDKGSWMKACSHAYQNMSRKQGKCNLKRELTSVERTDQENKQLARMVAS